MAFRFHNIGMARTASPAVGTIHTQQVPNHASKASLSVISKTNAPVQRKSTNTNNGKQLTVNNWNIPFSIFPKQNVHNYLEIKNQIKEQDDPRSVFEIRILKTFKRILICK